MFETMAVFNKKIKSVNIYYDLGYNWIVNVINKPNNLNIVTIE